MESNRYLIKVKSQKFRHSIWAEKSKIWEKSTILNFNSFRSAKLFATKWTKKLADSQTDLYVFTKIYLLPETSEPLKMDNPEIKLLAQKFPESTKWFSTYHGDAKISFELESVCD